MGRCHLERHRRQHIVRLAAPWQARQATGTLSSLLAAVPAGPAVPGMPPSRPALVAMLVCVAWELGVVLRSSAGRFTPHMRVSQRRRRGSKGALPSW